MARWTKGLLRTSLLVTLLLFWAAVGEGSVTWRRINKPSLKTTTPASVSSTSPTKKSSVTWRRSPITRRSTVAAEHNHEQERTEAKKLDESRDNTLEEFDEASSVQEEHIAEENLESDSGVKPLVPGSRPGFWFDSRRKTSSSLFRPGERRNSLFPTRSTTSTTQAPTTVAVTPLTVIPRTLPSIAATTAKSSNSKQFGLNRSTRTPITFRRRQKTTRGPKPIPVPEPSEKYKGSTSLKDDGDDKDKDGSALKEYAKNSDEPSSVEDADRISPLSRLRKRPYNGTRLSWIRKSGRTSTTTSIPLTQKTTISPKRTSTVPESEPFSRKTTKPSKLWSRTRSTTPPREASTTPKRDRTTALTEDSKSEEETFGKKHSAETSDEVTIKTSKIKHHPELEDYVDDNFEAEVTNNERETNENEKSSPQKILQRTTVEPFFITKEYGRIVTAVSETKENKRTDPDTRRKVKRIRPKATEAPTTTTTKIEEPLTEVDYDNEDSTEENEYSNDIENYSSGHVPLNRTTPLELERLEDKTEERPSTRIPITPSPVTLPALSTIGLDGDAYVVWSLGQGGSGWSYQKHGDDVKWSAQNSGAQGDRWSVVGKDEAANIKADLEQPWTSEKIILEDGKEMAPSRKTQDGYNTLPPSASYKPGSFPNVQTQHNTSSGTETSLSQTGENASSLQYPPSMKFTTSVSVSGIKYIDSSSNDTTSSNVPHSDPAERIINPSALDYPYISELKDQHNSPKNQPGLLKFPTEDSEGAAEQTGREPFSYPEQFDRFQSTNPYPTLPPLTETVPATFVDKQYGSVPAVGDPLQGYLSNIPPELARAVVEDKKWHVVGAGGDDGWSLLNDDGVLEWKIHNVDGKWKVTSAEQLSKLLRPPENSYVDEIQVQVNPKVTVQEYNVGVEQSPPKVWTFEDDYAKWRAVSSEKEDALDQSLSEKSVTSEDYDYGGQEYDSFTPSDDYIDYPPGENIRNSYASRPAYPVTQDKNQDPYYLGNIEIANSKEDAIAAWKSLLAQEGYRMVSGNPPPKSAPRQDAYLQNLSKNPKRTGSTQTPTTHEHVDKNQPRRFYESDDRLLIAKRKGDTEGSQRISSGVRQFTHDGNTYMQLNMKQVQSSRSEGHKEHYQSDYHLQEADTAGDTEVSDAHRGDNGPRDTITTSRLRIGQKDHPKLDALIEKLETIQRQAKGRAVVDLAKLLRQIKGQTNDTGKSPIGQNLNAQRKGEDTDHFDLQVDNIKQVNGGPLTLRKQHNERQTYGNQPIQNEALSSSLRNLRPENGRRPDNLQIPNQQTVYRRRQGHPSGAIRDQNKNKKRGDGVDLIHPQLGGQLPPEIIERFSHAKPNGRAHLPDIYSFLRQLDGNFELPTESSQQEDFKISLEGVKQEDYDSPVSKKLMPTRPELVVSGQRMENKQDSQPEQRQFTKEQRNTAQDYEQVKSSRGLTGGKQEPKQNYQTNDNQHSIARQLQQPKHGLSHSEYEFVGERYRTSENRNEAIRDQHHANLLDNLYAEKRKQKALKERIGTPENRNEISRDQHHVSHLENVYVEIGNQQEPRERYGAPENRNEIVRSQHDSGDSENAYLETRKQQVPRERYRGPENRNEITRDQHHVSHLENVYVETGNQQQPRERYGALENRNEIKRDQQHASHLENVYVETGNQQELRERYGAPENRNEPSRADQNSVNFEHKDHQGLSSYRSLANKYESPARLQRPQDQTIPENIAIVAQKVDPIHSSDLDNLGEIYVNLRDQDQQRKNKRVQRRKQRHRKTNRSPTNSTPIVLKGETEVEDQKSGSVRNRKIIVIDYAGTEKKQTSVDKKELELIIRNVRHRRAQVAEDLEK